MERVLIVVDMQNDFIDGSLGTPEAQAIVPKVVEKIRNWDGKVYYTMDTHEENYLETREGRHLPVKHCIVNTHGWFINDDVYRALREKNAECIIKSTFGYGGIAPTIEDFPLKYVEFCGLCTDICVISNALILQADLPEVEIGVDAECVAGTTPKQDEAALMVMSSCQIEVYNWFNKLAKPLS